MDPIGLVLLGLAFMSGAGGGASPAPAAPGGVRLPGGTPEWPQVVPSGLPKFPTGWEYDEPVPAAVQARAKQLVTQLWSQGAGATRTEQTAGRWITYRAEVVRSGNQGIVAYRLKVPAAPPRLPSSPGPEARLPAKTPKGPKRAPRAARAPRAPRAPGVTTSPGLPVSVQVGPAQLNPVQLPELKRGDGIKPQKPNPNVAFLQTKLTERGIPLKADGQFGKDTETAVIAFQVQHGLAPAEPIEQLRARHFGHVKLATWTALLEPRA
jgi:hypothetical protein